MWNLYNTNVIWVIEDTHLLSVSAKWLGGKSQTFVLPDYRLYKKDPKNDYHLCKEIWRMLDEADLVMGHNGDAFDLRRLTARFVQHGLPPPSPYRTIDTLKIARRYFGFTSNKLNDLCIALGVGKKVETDKNLWKDCMAGDMKAWSLMRKYNQNDILLLEGLYLKFRPWIKNHPNLGAWEERSVCPKCKSPNLQRRGYQYNQTTKYARLQCKDCLGWSRTRLNELEYPVLTNA